MTVFRAEASPTVMSTGRRGPSPGSARWTGQGLAGGRRDRRAGRVAEPPGLAIILGLLLPPALGAAAVLRAGIILLIGGFAFLSWARRRMGDV